MIVLKCYGINHVHVLLGDVNIWENYPQSIHCKSHFITRLLCNNVQTGTLPGHRLHLYVHMYMGHNFNIHSHSHESNPAHYTGSRKVWLPIAYHTVSPDDMVVSCIPAAVIPNSAGSHDTRATGNSRHFHGLAVPGNITQTDNFGIKSTSLWVMVYSPFKP